MEPAEHGKARPYAPLRKINAVNLEKVNFYLYLCTMNDTENKPKYIKYNDGKQGEELEIITTEFASEMPKEIRGKLAPSVLWIARRFRSTREDLQVNREKVADLEAELNSLQSDHVGVIHDTHKEEELTEKVTSLEQQTRDLAQARDKALQDLDDLKAQFTQELATPKDERTVEVARRIINAGKCPICGDRLYNSESQKGDKMVKCNGCRYIVYGTIENPKLTY